MLVHGCSEIYYSTFGDNRSIPSSTERVNESAIQKFFNFNNCKAVQHASYPTSEESAQSWPSAVPVVGPNIDALAWTATPLWLPLLQTQLILPIHPQLCGPTSLLTLHQWRPVH